MLEIICCWGAEWEHRCSNGVSRGETEDIRLASFRKCLIWNYVQGGKALLSVLARSIPDRKKWWARTSVCCQVSTRKLVDIPGRNAELSFTDVRGTGLEEMCSFWQVSLKQRSVGAMRGWLFRFLGVCLGDVHGKDCSGRGENVCSRVTQSLHWPCTDQSTILERWQAQ